MPGRARHGNLSMLTIYNDRHVLHHGKMEMFRGELVPCFEVPARADYVLQELRQRRFGPVEPPQDVPDSVLTRIHSQRYVDFLAGAWDEWVALDPANAQRDAIPSYWPVRTFRSDVLSASFPARMGLFSFDAGSPALAHALKAIAAFKADALVVSLGVDTFEGDPISGFGLQSADYVVVGGDIARAGLPTVFVFEGGYAVAEVGINTVNVLYGFRQRAG